MTRFQVTGSATEVTELLKGSLTAEELAAVQIQASAAASPFGVQPRRGEPIAITVLVWVGGAVATGMAYDVVKALSVKVWQILESRYGDAKVKKIEPDE